MHIQTTIVPYDNIYEICVASIAKTIRRSGGCLGKMINDWVEYDFELSPQRPTGDPVWYFDKECVAQHQVEILDQIRAWGIRGMSISGSDDGQLSNAAEPTTNTAESVIPIPPELDKDRSTTRSGKGHLDSGRFLQPERVGRCPGGVGRCHFPSPRCN